MAKRCTWAESHPLLISYHDEEWGVPVRNSRALWGKLMLDGFQAGLSWLTILKKRDAFYDAFHRFNPDKVARFNERDIKRLLKNEQIIRSRAKIESTIAGARVFLDMQSSGTDFAEFCWSFVAGTPIINTTGRLPAKTPLSEAISKELKQRGFKFVGPTIVYAWMQAVGMVNDHALYCFRRGEVTR